MVETVNNRGDGVASRNKKTNVLEHTTETVTWMAWTEQIGAQVLSAEAFATAFFIRTHTLAHRWTSSSVLDLAAFGGNPTIKFMCVNLEACSQRHTGILRKLDFSLEPLKGTLVFK
jgi:hypothetical protein